MDVNRLRFDFSYGKQIKKDELNAISEYVNECIKAGHPVMISEEALERAKERGAHAMFGEKYGNHVRVVEIPSVSIELCGGNHVTNTRDLQAFEIISEGAVAAGIRRIEALVGNERIADHTNRQRSVAYHDYAKRWDALVKSASRIALDMPLKLDSSASSDQIQTALEDLALFGKKVDKTIKGIPAINSKRFV